MVSPLFEKCFNKLFPNVAFKLTRTPTHLKQGKHHKNTTHLFLPERKRNEQRTSKNKHKQPTYNFKKLKNWTSKGYRKTQAKRPNIAFRPTRQGTPRGSETRCPPRCCCSHGPSEGAESRRVFGFWRFLGLWKPFGSLVLTAFLFLFGF